MVPSVHVQIDRQDVHGRHEGRFRCRPSLPAELHQAVKAINVRLRNCALSLAELARRDALTRLHGLLDERRS